MDFDDLLLNTVRLFRRASRRARALPQPLHPHPHRRVPGHQRRAVRARRAAGRRAPQHRAWSATTTSRSIAGAGPTSRNILDFEHAFPDATAITLDQNFRSTQTILDAANAVITNNVSRKPKTLWTDQGGGRADRPLPGRGRARRGRVGRPRDRPAARRPGPPVGRRRRLLPDQRPESPRWKRRWPAPRSPTRSSAAPSSTTARRSRTCSPTCGSW